MQVQTKPHSYTAYLQDLLQKHNISYLKQQQYREQQEAKHQDFIEGPLHTNLKPVLFGDLLSRYSRQMLLKEIGYSGQVKIVQAKIGLIGAGGIGCPLALYLAGAGVGTIGLFDSDVVDMTNLHRQIGHKTSTLNIPKTSSLKSTLLQLNPNIRINQHPFITKQTLSPLDQYDLIIDGSDNPKCRYLVNDYLMSKGRKLLSGACVGWEGQITCYGQNQPCYRCIWGDDQVSMGGCSTLGVVGMLPGFVGMILAIQAIKLIVNKKSSLEGHLLTYQARTCTFRKMKLRNKKPECIACGQHKMDIPTYNYDKYQLCKNPAANLPEVPTINWSEAITKMKDGNHIHIDVRPSAQYNIINLQQSKNIPYEDLSKMDKNKLHELFQQDKNIYVSCRSGVMSKLATNFLLNNGYDKVYNIEGGINKYGKLFDSNIVSI